MQGNVHGRKLFTKPEVKNILQQIYDGLGLVGKKAKANELEVYMNIQERMIKDSTGNRKEVYLILP